LESTSNPWLFGALAGALVVRQVVKLMMFKAALRNSNPAERPKIIHAMRGLIGRGTSARSEDKE
jgi:hypothetical protein